MTNEHPPIDPVALLLTPGNPHVPGSGGAIVFALSPAGVLVGYAPPEHQANVAKQLAQSPPPGTA